MYDVPEPKKFAQDIPADQLKAMQPIDKLVQYIVPRLIDKMNYTAWRMDKLEHETAEALQSMRVRLDEATAEPGRVDQSVLDDIYNTINELLTAQHDMDDRITALSKPARKKTETKVRRKAAEPAPSYVAHADYCTYDPDKDEWAPFEFEGVKLTASTIDAVRAGDITQPDIVRFVSGLTAEVEDALRKQFPG